LGTKRIDVVEELTNYYVTPSSSLSDEERKIVLLEVILIKYAAKSLEHVGKGLEKVKAILNLAYNGNQKSQEAALDLMMDVYGLEINDQKYEADNLFVLRDWVVSIVEKMCILDIFDCQVVIDWAVSRIA
jgi:hypothetical protein